MMLSRSLISAKQMASISAEGFAKLELSWQAIARKKLRKKVSPFNIS